MVDSSEVMEVEQGECNFSGFALERNVRAEVTVNSSRVDTPLNMLAAVVAGLQ